MTYEVFQNHINVLVLNTIKKTGRTISVRFFNDVENKVFWAYCSDGTIFKASSSSLKLSVMFGME